MEQKVREIDDKVLIGQFVHSLFPRLPVSMLYKGKQIPVKILDTNKLGVVIRATGVSEPERILTFTNSGSLYNFYFSVSDKSTDDLEYLIPEKMVIYPAVSRRAERKVLKGNEKNEIFISSITLVNDILLKISYDKDWISTIEENLKSLVSKYKSVNFYSVMESNVHVKLGKLLSKPFRYTELGHHSMKEIFCEKSELSHFLTQTEWEQIEAGEIIFPLYFRNKVFLGSIVLKTPELDLEAYKQTTYTIQLILKDLHTKNDVVFYKNKLNIEDISQTGIGFRIGKDVQISSLQPGNKILIELTFSRGLTAFLEAIVRNLREFNANEWRIGCEFVNISPEEKVFLENFLPNSQ